MVRRILVALSGTPYTPVAIRQAIELAQRHDASVTGVTIVDLPALSDVGPIPIGGSAAAHSLAEHRMQITQERVEEEIANFEKACRNASITRGISIPRGQRTMQAWQEAQTQGVLAPASASR
jgi:nucleotide-binding universal stress UspA family protein